MNGKEFRRISEKLGLTQKEFAERLGIAANSLARLERGERRISETTARLATLLGLIGTGAGIRNGLRTKTKK